MAGTERTRVATVLVPAVVVAVAPVVDAMALDTALVMSVLDSDDELFRMVAETEAARVASSREPISCEPVSCASDRRRAEQPDGDALFLFCIESCPK